jgi:hypothetical protein
MANDAGEDAAEHPLSQSRSPDLPAGQYPPVTFVRPALQGINVVFCSLLAIPGLIGVFSSGLTWWG